MPAGSAPVAVGENDAEEPYLPEAEYAAFEQAAEAAVNRIGTSAPTQRQGVAPRELSEIATAMTDAFEAERQRDRTIRGIRTGFPSLDEHFCGFARQQLVVIHGLSGYGKSHFANHCLFATALAEQTKGDAREWTVVFLCEGMAESLLSAFLGYRYGVPEQCREAGSASYSTPEIEEAIANGRAEFGSLPILVTDEIKQLVDIEQYIRDAVKQYPVAGVVVDHLQEVKAPGCKNPSHQGVNMVSEHLRDLSEKELHIPIVGLSQTTADQKGNYNPQYGNAIREKSSLCFQLDRGKQGCKREEAVQSNLLRVVNDKSRWKRVAPTLTLVGDYQTGRMYEEAEWLRLQAQRQAYGAHGEDIYGNQ